MLTDGLHCGDCLELLPQVPAASVDLVFADLPYGKTRNKWDVLIPLDRLWAALKPACKPNAVFVFTAVQPFASDLVASNRAWFRYEMIWKKNKSGGFLNANRRPLLAHENVLVFWNKQPRYRPQMTDGHEPLHAATRLDGGNGANYGKTRSRKSNAGATKRYPTSILEIPVVNNDDPGRIHPTQKPTDLAAWFIKTYTDPGDLVLDPVAGSGSALQAAIRLGRRAIGFEKDRKIYELARAALGTPST